MLSFSQIAKYFAVITCYIGSYSVMFIIGYSSPTQRQLVQEGIIGYYSLPLYASIVYATRLLGYLIVPFMVQTNCSNILIGVVNCVIGGVGWLLVITAKSAYTLITGVGLVGFYSGVTTVITMAYVAEISLEQQRGVMCGGIGFSMRGGLLFVYTVGIWLSFRWLAVVGLLLVVVFACSVLFVPHSPVWFVRQGLNARARDTLLFLNGHNFDADAEIEKITTTNASAKSSLRASLSALKDLQVLKPILIVSVFGLLEEVGGHPAMVALSSHILESQEGLNPNIASVFYPIFLIMGAIVSMCIVGKFKLKWQFIFAEALQAISHFSFSIYYLVSEQILGCDKDYSLVCNKINYWPIFNIALYAIAFGFGYGSIFFSHMGMMYNSHRELSLSITGIVLNISCFLVTIIFYFLLHSLGGSSTFLIFTCIHLITVIYLFIFIDI